MKLNRRVAIAALAAGVLAGSASGADAAAGSPRADALVLVELFTSEGCSSCPPADALLRELRRDQPVPGTRVVALGQHVDYWDDLGWNDPFSSADLTRRQKRYATRFGNASLYTPQMVVDGREEFLGSDRARALGAITRASRRPKAFVSVEPNRARPVSRLTIRIDGLADGEPADVWLALTESDRTTDVRHGENAGRTLHHVAVVRSLTRVGRVDPARERSIELDVALPADERIDRARLGAVVFVQQIELGPVLATAEVDLAPQADGARNEVDRGRMRPAGRGCIVSLAPRRDQAVAQRVRETE